MDEYPKVIQVGALKVTAQDAEDEARWRSAVPVAQLPPPSPVSDDVPVEQYRIETDQIERRAAKTAPKPAAKKRAAKPKKTSKKK